VTEAQAAEIVKAILEKPTHEAFDTAAGAIIRLFASLNQVTRRVARLEERIRVLEVGPISAARGPAVAATAARLHRGRYKWNGDGADVT